MCRYVEGLERLQEGSPDDSCMAVLILGCTRLVSSFSQGVMFAFAH